MSNDFSSPEDWASQVTAEPAIMRLAHPVRCAAAEPRMVSSIHKMLPPRATTALEQAFAQSQRMTSNILASFLGHPDFEALSGLVKATSRLPGGSELGNLYASLLLWRHHAAPQPYFRIDDALCAMLHATDLDDDIPVEAIKAPYPRAFIEFGARRDLPLHILNDLSGRHVLEGAYIEAGERNAEESGIYIMLTGSPLGKRNALDDAIHAVFLPTNKGFTLKKALEWSFSEGRRLSEQHGLVVSNPACQEPTLECLNFLVKVLLYIGLPEARRSIHPEKTHWVASHSGLKSTAKVAKAQRRARLLTDYILITASTDAQRTAHELDREGRSVRSHWRRGHYRMQAHGVQMSLRKVVFIAPTLVNPDQIGASAAAPSYRVG